MGREKQLNSKLVVSMAGATTKLAHPTSNAEQSFTFDYSYNSMDSSAPDFAGQDKVFADLGTPPRHPVGRLSRWFVSLAVPFVGRANVPGSCLTRRRVCVMLLLRWCRSTVPGQRVEGLQLLDLCVRSDGLRQVLLHDGTLTHRLLLLLLLCLSLVAA